jgi:membrane protein DedA with SNARE-associated domain
VDYIWWVSGLGYTGVAVLIAAESLGLPVPGQLGLVMAAYLCGPLGFDPIVLAMVAAGAHASGSFAAFMVGKKLGRPGLQLLLAKWSTVARGVDRSERLLQRWEGWGVLALQLLPYVRDYVGYAAGLAGVRTAGYVAGLAPASLLWAGASVLVGTGAGHALSADRLASFAVENRFWLGLAVLSSLLAAVGLKKLPRRAQ